eukprot:CFRG6899T1
MVHIGVSCDGCSVEDIAGLRHKCLICTDFDLCDECAEMGVEEDAYDNSDEDSDDTEPHKESHPMQMIIDPDDFDLFLGPGSSAAGRANMQTYTCPTCNQIGLSIETLTQHAANHEQNPNPDTPTPERAGCPICVCRKGVFHRQIYCLREHLETVHAGGRLGMSDNEDDHDEHENRYKDEDEDEDEDVDEDDEQSEQVAYERELSDFFTTLQQSGRSGGRSARDRGVRADVDGSIGGSGDATAILRDAFRQSLEAEAAHIRDRLRDSPGGWPEDMNAYHTYGFARNDEDAEDEQEKDERLYNEMFGDGSVSDRGPFNNSRDHQKDDHEDDRNSDMEEICENYKVNNLDSHEQRVHRQMALNTHDFSREIYGEASSSANMGEGVGGDIDESGGMGGRALGGRAESLYRPQVGEDGGYAESGPSNFVVHVEDGVEAGNMHDNAAQSEDNERLSWRRILAEVPEERRHGTHMIRTTIANNTRSKLYSTDRMTSQGNAGIDSTNVPENSPPLRLSPTSRVKYNNRAMFVQQLLMSALKNPVVHTNISLPNTVPISTSTPSKEKEEEEKSS